MPAPLNSADSERMWRGLWEARLAVGQRVAVNRELAALSVLFNRCSIDQVKFDGINSVRMWQEPMGRRIDCDAWRTRKRQAP